MEHRDSPWRSNFAPVAWSNATTAPGNSGWLHGEPLRTSPNVLDLATVEIADATSVNTLRTLADFSQCADLERRCLENLENNALDTSAETNVQVRQLNLEAAGTVQILRNQQNIIDVLGYQLEQWKTVNKPVRDGIAATLSRYSAMQATGANGAHRDRFAGHVCWLSDLCSPIQENEICFTARTNPSATNTPSLWSPVA